MPRIKSTPSDAPQTTPEGSAPPVVLTELPAGARIADPVTTELQQVAPVRVTEAKKSTPKAPPPAAKEFESKSKALERSMSRPVLTVYDDHGFYDIEFETARECVKALQDLERRLAKVRGTFKNADIEGLHVTDANHLHIGNGYKGPAPAFLHVRFPHGETDIPMPSFDRARSVAREVGIKLVQGRACAISDALDGRHSILRCCNIKALATEQS